MLEVPVYNMSGDRTGSIEIDPALLGGEVRPALLKQAIVTQQANRRQGTAATKNRSMVTGSTRKLYRQKGSGNARAGAARTHVRRGGGVAFAKGDQVFSRALPKKMKRLARNNAILAKIEASEVVVVEGLSFEEPKTQVMAKFLNSIGAAGGCVLALRDRDENALKSGRNIPKTEIRLVRDLNAYEVLRRRKLVFSKPAFEVLRADPVLLRSLAGADDE